MGLEIKVSENSKVEFKPITINIVITVTDAKTYKDLISDAQEFDKMEGYVDADGSELGTLTKIVTNVVENLIS